MSAFLVHRCICHNIDFVDIKEYVTQNNIEHIIELQNNEICSTKCQLCKPYVEILIETGVVQFKPGAYIPKKNTSSFG